MKQEIVDKTDIPEGVEDGPSDYRRFIEPPEDFQYLIQLYIVQKGFELKPNGQLRYPRPSQIVIGANRALTLPYTLQCVMQYTQKWLQDTAQIFHRAMLFDSTLRPPFVGSMINEIEVLPEFAGRPAAEMVSLLIRHPRAVLAFQSSHIYFS